MNQIKYNEKEEAFEITYKIWDKNVTVRFYVEEQQDILDNIGIIAQKLDILSKSRDKVCEIISDDGYYEGHSDVLSKNIEIIKCYVDIETDEDETDAVVCFTVDSTDGYLAKSGLNLELYGSEFEITGYDR